MAASVGVQQKMVTGQATLHSLCTVDQFDLPHPLREGQLPFKQYIIYGANKGVIKCQSGLYASISLILGVQLHESYKCLRNFTLGHF